MKKAAAHTTTHSPSGKDHFGLGTLAADLLNTAWRIALPVLIGAGIGIVGDTQLDSGPWLTLAGMVLGFVGAGLLLKGQLHAIETGDKS